MPRRRMDLSKASIVRRVSRADLCAALDWGCDFFKKEFYEVLDVPALSLLHPHRFDLLAKFIFAEHLVRGVRSDFGERIYAEHIRVWNGFHEEVPSKGSRNDFVESFRTLVSDVAKHGSATQRRLVPVDRMGRIIDGSHRVAVGIATHTTLRVVQTETAAHDRSIPPYDYRFFATSRSHVAGGLAQSYSDEMARTYCRLKPSTRVVVLFPAADRARDGKAAEILGEAGAAVYARSFILNQTGAYQFIRHLYAHDPRGWMGSIENGYAGARDKAMRCFKAWYPCRVILIDPAPNVDLLEIKRRLRSLYGTPDAVHISDGPNELPMVTGFALNRNSIDFFNSMRPRIFAHFDALFREYAHALAAGAVWREDVAVHGSACLAAAGLRDCRDIDFLGFGDAARSIDRLGFSRRPVDALVTPEYVDSVIFDPGNHFWYFGHKFTSLEAIRAYKRARSEHPKDYRDVTLINQVLKPTRWDRAVTSYFSSVGLRRPSARDLLRSVLDRAGLLKHVRRIRG